MLLFIASALCETIPGGRYWQAVSDNKRSLTADALQGRHALELFVLSTCCCRLPEIQESHSMTRLDEALLFFDCADLPWDTSGPSPVACRCFQHQSNPSCSRRGGLRSCKRILHALRFGYLLAVGIFWPAERFASRGCSSSSRRPRQGFNRCRFLSRLQLASRIAEELLATAWQPVVGFSARAGLFALRWWELVGHTAQWRSSTPGADF